MERYVAFHKREGEAPAEPNFREKAAAQQELRPPTDRFCGDTLNSNGGAGQASVAATIDVIPRLLRPLLGYRQG